MVAALERAGHDYSEDQLKKALPRLGQKTVEDVLAAVARNEIKTADVVQILAPDVALPAKPARPEPEGKTQRGWLSLTRAASHALNRYHG